MTWRYLLARLVAIYRLWRVRFHYCGTCGVPLMENETTTCAECIEYEQAEREHRVKLQQQLALQHEQMMRQFAMQGRAGYGYHAFVPPAMVGLSEPSFCGIPMTPEEWERFDGEVS